MSVPPDRAAHTRRQTNTMCDVCQAAVNWSKALERKDQDYLSLEFQPSFDALQESALNCSLCAFIFHDMFNGKPHFQEWRTNEMKQRRNYSLHIERQKGLSKIWCEEKFPDFPHPLPSSGIPGFYFISFPSEIGNRAIWRSENPVFGDRLQTVAEWISQCDFQHAICKEHILIRPKRLLDLSLVDSMGQVKLVNTADIIKPIRYATLSHCWGPPTSKPPLRTHHATLQAHYHGIPMNILSSNFRDAVIISRKLGLDYLWIDSLCIIQDDNADWKTEAANMGNIYQGSYINIAATASNDAYGGLISSASVSLQKPATTIRPLSSDPPADSGCTDNFSFMIRAPLGDQMQRALSGCNYRYFTRGWILQELALSPRTVHFPEGQILWQCRHCFTIEDGTVWSRDLRSSADGYNFASSLSLGNMEKPHRMWNQWVASYCGRELTFAEDVGPAIAGLISFFGTRTGFTPLLGLWKETLAFDLYWHFQYRIQKRPPPLEPKKSEFPSWSWLSVLPQQDGEFSNGVQHEVNPISLRIEGWAVQWSGPEFVSSLLHSRLVLSSFVRTATVTVPAPGTWTASTIYPIFVSGDPSWEGVCHLEYLFPERISRSVILLQLFQGQNRQTESVTIFDCFLVLLPRPENPHQFYRIGAGDVQTWLLDDMVEDKEKTSHWDIHFKESDRRTIELV